jgi:hypothetical protein
MTYFQSLVITLVFFKLALIGVVLLSWLVPVVQRRWQTYRKWLAVPAAARTKDVRRRSTKKLSAPVKKNKSTDWVKGFRLVFMVLFVAYPSVSIKIFRLFNCVAVEGRYWLTADVRLQCYTREWYGYAIYGLVMAVVYVAGLPITIFAILLRHRNTLYGPGSDVTLQRYGFLYDRYERES